MKLTNLDILNINGVLQQNMDKHFPQSIMYALFKDQKVIQDSIEIYNTALKKLVNDFMPYVEKDEDEQPQTYANGLIKVTADKEQEYLDELNSLLSVETDLELYKVDDSVFNYNEEKYDTLSIDLMNLLAK